MRTAHRSHVSAVSTAERQLWAVRAQKRKGNLIQLPASLDHRMCLLQQLAANSSYGGHAMTFSFKRKKNVSLVSLILTLI